jgi:predicted nucleic acid-binding protein
VTRVALDSNMFITAEIDPIRRRVRSADLILWTVRDGVIPAQALGGFFRFVQRRASASFEDAIRQALLYQSVFITPPTTDAIINKASELSRAHRLQLWDCVVCAASAEARAKVLLTEDMQDGRVLDGLRLMNPFVAANAKSIDDLLAR